jgi:hypothetical protein
MAGGNANVMSVLLDAADALVLSDPDATTSEPAHAINATTNDPMRLGNILLTAQLLLVNMSCNKGRSIKLTNSEKVPPTIFGVAIFNRPFNKP